MLADTVTVRRATLADAGAIADVQVASWHWAYRGALPEATLAALDPAELSVWWRSVLGDPERIVLVATERDDVLGFAHAASTDDDDRNEGTGQLYALYLIRRAAGAGIGRILLERATDAMRTAGFVAATLWVLESNERARRFYERAGWSWDGTRSTHQVQCSNMPIVRYTRRL